jgi:hypothetical protein
MRKSALGLLSVKIKFLGCPKINVTLNRNKKNNNIFFIFNYIILKIHFFSFCSNLFMLLFISSF